MYAFYSASGLLSFLSLLLYPSRDLLLVNDYDVSATSARK